MPAEAVEVHGLTAEFLADKPLFADVTDEFLAFVGDAPRVAHNAGFDIAFLNAELKRGQGTLHLVKDRQTLHLVKGQSLLVRDVRCCKAFQFPTKNIG
jgi:DNA polymerase III epsilon subunit-like protein